MGLQEVFGLLGNVVNIRVKGEDLMKKWRFLRKAFVGVAVVTMLSLGLTGCGKKAEPKGAEHPAGGEHPSKEEPSKEGASKPDHPEHPE